MINAQPTDLQKKLAAIQRAAEEREAERRARKTNHPYADLRRTPVAIEALRLVPEQEARNAEAVAIEIKKRDVAVACVDPESAPLQALVKNLEAGGYRAKVFIASRSGIEKTWEMYKFASPHAKEITGKIAIAGSALETLMARFKNFQIIRDEMGKLDFGAIDTTDLLAMTLAGGLAIHASDIHLEAGEKKSKVRLRLDGFLHDICDSIPPSNYAHLISRIKLLSNLKINVRDQAQDGRFTIGLSAKEIEVRVSIIPSEFGETIVMRLLDPGSISVSLSDLGLRPDDLALVRRQLERPNGLLLNTGPTGSGKTTTLYAFLRQVTDPETKVITVEDPIEYRIEGIEQTQVNPGAGYTFASGLRSILRQDPDVILVGEVRDRETADIALQAALTGHLVFSTLHTNDAVGAVPRLVDLGVKPSTIGPALSLIIAQRLVRTLCPECKKPAEPTPELAEKIEKVLERLPAKVDRTPYESPTVFEAAEKGTCEKCGGFGYKGRVGVFEFFETGPEFEEAILKEISVVVLKKLAEKQGMVSMQTDGILKALQGVTSFAEVTSVTGAIEW